jgi:ankyrin repeat protein
VGRRNETALYYTVKLQKTPVAQALLQAKADPFLVSSANETPYDIAVRTEQTQIVQSIKSMSSNDASLALMCR